MFARAGPLEVVVTGGGFVAVGLVLGGSVLGRFVLGRSDLGRGSGVVFLAV